MGCILLPARVRALSTEFDEAGEVGSVGDKQASVMVVGRTKPGGPLIYQGEVDGSLWFRPRNLQIRDYGTLSWIRMEFRVPRANGVVAERHQFVVAEHPYSNGWVHRTRFKTPYKKGPVARRRLLARLQKGSNNDRAIIRRVEALPNDLWESGRFLTAAISAPEMPHGNLDAQVSWKIKARLVLGTCRDFHACESELFNSDRVSELLQLTEQNRIRFWSRKAKPTSLPRLFQEVIDEAPSLMLLSIRQALAGPHAHCGSYVGKPVIVKVSQIYRGHLNNRNRQVSRNIHQESKYQKEYVDRARSARRRSWRTRNPDDTSP